jgi:DNA mismatch repair ATPase MutL
MFGSQEFAQSESDGETKTFMTQASVTQATMFSSNEQEQLRDKEIGEYKVIGQLWNSYILLESVDALYYIDQHALAERILFEKIKAAPKHTD